VIYVLAYHSLWLGQLGSGVGIFNGLFQVTSLSIGIDLFIYIVASLILLISETGVFKYALQLNKAAPAQLSWDGACRSLYIYITIEKEGTIQER
jgi:hypothetical protein